MSEHEIERPSDEESYRLLYRLKHEFEENFDNRSAQEAANLFNEFLDTYKTQSALYSKDKTLWARNEALKIIAEETDMKFAHTPDNLHDAENKRKLGSSSYFKNRYNIIQRDVLNEVM